MISCSFCYLLLLHLFLIKVTANLAQIRTIDAQQDERIRLECTVTSKFDAEEAMWMRIRPPHNPDILTYRDAVVYTPDRIQLEQRRLSSSINANGTFIDTYFLTLTILRPNIDDEGRYICSRGKNIFAEYDLFIIVPPEFVDDNSFIQQRSLVEGSTLQLSCSAHGRPKPSISWFSRTTAGKHQILNDGITCDEPVCELRWGNYTRNDPTIIECVADNGKSTRVSKVFHVDIYYPPKVIVNLQTFTGSRTIDVLLQCSSISNPPAMIQWFDENHREIHSGQFFTINTINQSSTLSFSVSPIDQVSFIYYCQSNNSIGFDEKSMDISEMIQFDTIILHESTTVPVLSPSTPIARTNLPLIRRIKTLRPNRDRSRKSTTTPISEITSTMAASSTNSFTSFDLNRLFYSFILLVLIRWSV